MGLAYFVPGSLLYEAPNQSVLTDLMGINNSNFLTVGKSFLGWISVATGRNTISALCHNLTSHCRRVIVPWIPGTGKLVQNLGQVGSGP